MAVYQVKVYYGIDFHKCGTFFTSSTEDFNFYGFVSRVKDITKTFHDVSVDQIRANFRTVGTAILAQQLLIFLSLFSTLPYLLKYFCLPNKISLCSARK